MKVKLDPEIFRKLKKYDVRIRKQFKEQIILFSNDPSNLQLNNHELRKPYEGLRSIDVTNDYRALYREKNEGDEVIAYFETIGTHKELYGKNNN